MPTTEVTYLLAPTSNYRTIQGERLVPQKTSLKGLSLEELEPFIIDAHWKVFRIVILVLLFITFATLLTLAVWICYNEYIYNCYNRNYGPGKVEAAVAGSVFKQLVNSTSASAVQSGS